MMWHKVKMSAMLLAGVAVAGTGGASAVRDLSAAEPRAAAHGRTILGAGSYWRAYATYEGKAVQQGSEKKPLGKTFHTAPAPAGWAAPDFDDSAWVLSRGPVAVGGFAHAAAYHDSGMALVCLRGKFRVTNPGAAGKLKLSLRYAGGAVVYLNGQEVARGHLPKGKPEALTPAESYPQGAYVQGGALVTNPRSGKSLPPEVAKCRERKLNAELPGKLLRKGVNVLAVELHRSSFRTEALKWGKKHGRTSWAHIAFNELHLTTSGSGVEPKVARPDGVQVWNADPHRLFSAADYGDPCEPLVPVKLVGARNGVYSGQVVVSSGKDITGLKATATGLSGPGKIPAKNVRVRYAAGIWLGVAADRTGLGYKGWEKVLVFAALKDQPPAGVKAVALRTNPAVRARLGVPAKLKPGALVPVWVTVKVPEDAKPGSYKGTLSISGGGVSKKVPIELEVIGWTVPSPKDFRLCVSTYQSPETLAIQYGVPPWSEKHWKLIERSFQIMGELGNRFLCVPLITRTQFGNEHSMIRWIKDGNGYKYDFSIYDRYAALAAKYCRIKIISYQVYLSCKWSVPGPEKPTFVTVAEGKDLKPMKLEPYGSGNSEKHWKKLIAELKERQKKAGMGDALVVMGITQDCGVHKDVRAFFKKIFPEAWWHYGAHHRPRGGETKIYGLSEYLYVPGDIPDPRVKRKHGWKNAPLVLTCQRMRDDIRPPMSVRSLGERSLTLGDNGPGRMCIDYWPVKGSVRSPGGTSLFNRWPESTSGQRCPFLTYLCVPGNDRAVMTVKTEALREGFQEAEARIVVDEALVGGKISGDLAKRCQKLLDERTQCCRVVHGCPRPVQAAYTRGWQKRAEELYRLAAEVAKKLGR